MENLRDKMLNAILKKFTSPTDRFDTHNVDILAEACARVAEEEIAKVIEEAAKVAKVKSYIPHVDGWANPDGPRKYVVDKDSILQLKDKYLKSLK